MRILMIAMSSYWQWMAGNVNRNQAIWNAMIADRDVNSLIFVGYVPYTVRRMIKDRLMEKKYRQYTRIKKTFFFSCFRIHEKCLMIQPRWMWRNPRAFQKKLIRFIATLSMQDADFDCVWSYNPIFPWQRMSTERLVFDAVDNWAVHPAWRRCAREILAGYQMIEKTYDVIFTVSQTLKSTLFGNHPKTYWIGNGVDTRLFTGIAASHPKTKTPSVVYSGIIQQRVDVELMIQCAQALPDVVLYIAGPIWRGVDVSGLQKQPNIHLLGFVPYQQLPILLSESWVGIIPHIVDPLTSSMNPMKLYEYMASELPVVTTALPDIPKSPYIIVALSRDEFVSALRRFTQHQPVRAQYDMQEYDWQSRYGAMKQHLGFI